MMARKIDGNEKKFKLLRNKEEKLPFDITNNDKDWVQWNLRSTIKWGKKSKINLLILIWTEGIINHLFDLSRVFSFIPHQMYQKLIHFWYGRYEKVWKYLDSLYSSPSQMWTLKMKTRLTFHGTKCQIEWPSNEALKQQVSVKHF